MAEGPELSLAANEDQELIRGAALQFLAEQEPLAELRALRDGAERSGVSAALWAEMAALGWPGLLAPEDLGGAGLGFQELGVVFEALGRHLVSSPLLSSGVLAASALTIVEGWARLPKAADLTTGGLRVALALEETSRFAPDVIETVAQVDGSGCVLSGRKVTVLDGATADTLLVLARLGSSRADSLGLFAVPVGAPGLSLQSRRWIDGRRVATLELEGVALSAEAMLGEPRSAEALVEPLIDRGSAALAAELVGISAEAFSLTLAYLKTREQFDQMLAEFQALQHRCARMFVEIERTISIVRDALRAIDEGDPEVSIIVSGAKAMASETARLVTEEALQLFGGLGMTEEQNIGLYFKRARTSSVLFGGADFHYRRVATLSEF